MDAGAGNTSHPGPGPIGPGPGPCASLKFDSDVVSISAIDGTGRLRDWIIFFGAVVDEPSEVFEAVDCANVAVATKPVSANTWIARNALLPGR